MITYQPIGKKKRPPSPAALQAAGQTVPPAAGCHVPGKAETQQLKMQMYLYIEYFRHMCYIYMSIYYIFVYLDIIEYVYIDTV